MTASAWLQDKWAPCMHCGGCRCTGHYWARYLPPGPPPHRCHGRHGHRYMYSDRYKTCPNACPPAARAASCASACLMLSRSNRSHESLLEAPTGRDPPAPLLPAPPAPPLIPCCRCCCWLLLKGVSLVKKLLTEFSGREAQPHLPPLLLPPPPSLRWLGPGCHAPPPEDWPL
jgi:hypothetical protein